MVEAQEEFGVDPSDWQPLSEVREHDRLLAAQPIQGWDYDLEKGTWKESTDKNYSK